VTSDASAVRQRLLDYGARDFVDLWPEVMAQRAALLVALDGVTEEQVVWRPGTGDGEDAWSILEVAQHLLGWTWNIAGIIEATGNGRTERKLPPGYIEPRSDVTLAQVREELTRATMSFATAPERLPDPPDLDTTVEHGTFGPMNCRMWFAMACIHDGNHTRQIEALKHAEGFPA
jgi:hypothetical protein